MDLVIFFVLMAVVVCLFKRFSSFIYYIAIVDILLRILYFIRTNIGLPEISNLIGKYCPSSIPGIIGTYTNGIFYTVLMWGYVIIYIIFLCYTIRIFWKKR